MLELRGEWSQLRARMASCERGLTEMRRDVTVAAAGTAAVPEPSPARSTEAAGLMASPAVLRPRPQVYNMTPSVATDSPAGQDSVSAGPSEPPGDSVRGGNEVLPETSMGTPCSPQAEAVLGARSLSPQHLEAGPLGSPRWRPPVEKE